MADNVVNFRMTATEQSAVAAWLNLRRQGPQGMMNDMSRLGAASGRAARTTQTMFAGAMRGFGQAALALAGISTPLMAIFTFANKVRMEAEAIRRAQEKSGREAVDVGRAKEILVKQKLPEGGFITMEDGPALRGRAEMAEYIEQQVRATAGQRSITDAQAIQMVGDAISAQSGEDVGRVLDATLSVMTRMQEQDSDAQLQVAKFMSIMQEGGIFDRPGGEKIDTSGMIGVFNEFLTRGPSGSEDLAALVQNMTPAIRELGLAGESYEDALAIFASIQKGSQDVTGQVTRTSLINLIGDVRGLAMRSGKGTLGKDLTFTEAVDFIRSDPEAQMQLIGQYSDKLEKIIEENIDGAGDLMLKELKLTRSDYKGLIRQRARTRMSAIGLFTTEAGESRKNLERFGPAFEKAYETRISEGEREVAKLSGRQFVQFERAQNAANEEMRNTLERQVGSIFQKTFSQETIAASGESATYAQIMRGLNFFSSDDPVAMLRATQKRLGQRAEGVFDRQGIDADIEVRDRTGYRHSRQLASARQLDEEIARLADEREMLSKENQAALSAILEQMRLVASLAERARREENATNSDKGKTPAEASQRD